MNARSFLPVLGGIAATLGPALIDLSDASACGCFVPPDPSVPVVDLSRLTVPGLGVVLAVPHGAVFSRGQSG